MKIQKIDITILLVILGIIGIWSIVFLYLIPDLSFNNCATCP